MPQFSSKGVTLRVNDLYGLGGFILKPGSVLKPSRSPYDSVKYAVDEESLEIIGKAVELRSKIRIGEKRYNGKVELKSSGRIRPGSSVRFKSLDLYYKDELFWGFDGFDIDLDDFEDISLTSDVFSKYDGNRIIGSESSDVIFSTGFKSYNESYFPLVDVNVLEGNDGGDLLVSRDVGALMIGGSGKDVFVVDQYPSYIEDYDPSEDILVIKVRKKFLKSGLSFRKLADPSPWAKGVGFGFSEEDPVFFLKTKRSNQDLEGNVFFATEQQLEGVEKKVLASFGQKQSSFIDHYDHLTRAKLDQAPIIISPEMRLDAEAALPAMIDGRDGGEILLHVPGDALSYWRLENKYNKKYRPKKFLEDPIIFHNGGKSSHKVLKKTPALYAVNQYKVDIAFNDDRYIDSLIFTHQDVSDFEFKVIGDRQFKKVVKQNSLQDLYDIWGL